jgi:hypothetical protein
MSSEWIVNKFRDRGSNPCGASNLWPCSLMAKARIFSIKLPITAKVLLDAYPDRLSTAATKDKSCIGENSRSGKF